MKKRMLVYMDREGIFYSIQGKKTDLTGKVQFNEVEKEDKKERVKLLRQEVTSISRKLKVKEVDYVLKSGVRMVKVFDMGKDLALNNDTELILRDEVVKFLQPSENINDYELTYLKTSKKRQKVFLTTLVNKKALKECCNLAKLDKIPLGKIHIPEEIMFELIKDKHGARCVILYDAQALEVRILVGNSGNFVYAHQSPNIYATDIDSEIENIKNHVKSKYNLDLLEILVVGVDPQYVEADDIISCIGCDNHTSKEHWLKGV